MGYLKGYGNISKAADHQLELPSEEIFEAFQVQVFDLIHVAYLTIRTPSPLKENPDEESISANLFITLELIASREEIPLTVIWEQLEITDEIIFGMKRAISSKRYDIYFRSWNSRHLIKFGVEAKLLSEHNFMSRVASTLIREYVSNAGMGKYINGIYKNRGCMIGYIVEGDIQNIIIKINALIEKVMDRNHCIKKGNRIKYKHKEIYKSQHLGKLDYDLYHLMLAFN